MAATNLPFGLQPVKYLNGASWNNQVGATTYYIQSQTSNNIFYGDPVVLDNSGHVQALGDFLNSGTPTDSRTAPILGVFLGCSYQTTTAIDPINSANPGRMYWPADTTTLNDMDAQAFIADDPNIVYLVRSGAGLGVTPGFQNSDIGKQFSIGWTQTGASPNVYISGNTFTGTSLAYVDGPSGSSSTTTWNVTLIGIPTDNGNQPGVADNLGWVIIQNHAYMSRPSAQSTLAA